MHAAAARMYEYHMGAQIAGAGAGGGGRGGRVSGASGQTPDWHVLQPGERGGAPVARAGAARLLVLLARVRARARARRARLRVRRRACALAILLSSH